MPKREILAPVLLFGMFSVLGVAFALVNLHLREDRRELILHGVTTTGTIERVIYSHNGCNSNVVVSYHDLGGHLWRQRFQTCVANHTVGESLGVTYLQVAPGTAILRRGLWIGAMLAVFGTVMIVRTICGSTRNYMSGK